MARAKKTKPKTPASAALPSSTKSAPPPSRKYESSAPAPQQLTFPPRRKIVRTYGSASTRTRRSLPARLDLEDDEEEQEEVVEKRRSLRQQTLTQAGYVTSQPGLGELRVDAGFDLEAEEEAGTERVRGKEAAEAARGKGLKRRRTIGGDAVPALERKVSRTQTLTQFLGVGEGRDAGLRIEDDEEEDNKERGKGVGVPHTPSNKRVRVGEVPSSQPTPFTPLLGYSPIMSYRSPLTQKSTNLGGAPPPPPVAGGKLPRNLVIQDSYSDGLGSSSAAADSSPGKEEEVATPSQKPAREALAEIPVGSLELGVYSTPVGETPTARRKRMFVEIPDSDDDLESLGSTPLRAVSTPHRTRSAQQTPLRREVVADEFEIAADPGSAPRSAGAAAGETPASVGRSDKENDTPAVRVLDDAESTASEGSPTPRLAAKKSQAAARASQVSPNTASQFWTASVEMGGSLGRPSQALGSSRTEVAALEEGPNTVEEAESAGTPTPAPRESQFHGSMGGSSGKRRHATPQLEEDADETAREAEEEYAPPSILRKAASQKTPRPGSGKKRDATPELARSESSTDKEPSTPTPVVRRVQIALPPPSTAEEVYKETPRKPHKSSPIYQRHTQARSQYYSQGLESQRVPMEMIRSLGPQTDRSDIIASIDAAIVDEIIKGSRDHEFRAYKFPIQVLRCWIFTAHADAPEAGEVKYMATLGPAQEPGQIDSGSGVGNAEFNAGVSGHAFAHKLVQVYQLNNPVPLEDMEDNGLGVGAPPRYRYLPPAVVGQLLANLRCPLFAEEGEDEVKFEEDEEDVEESVEDIAEEPGSGSVTISQELAEQLRSDIVHSTQLNERRHHHHPEEEDIIPASQSPLQPRPPPSTARNQPADSFPLPTTPRSAQRRRNNTPRPSNPIRPSQATTASDLSLPSSPAKSSVPRPPMPQSSSGLSSLLPPQGVAGLLLSSQAGGLLLPPDSLLLDMVGMAPPPVEVWDSEEEEE
ncbi:hypothetical protein C8A05DRAFT_44171 [Staphylotrichum tortipilum]|uniref:Uncharacterized protein n=1 Tax=Staphylotrichum tortipilum TaxID=2831512 RepID=A0AAN6RT31_9PEZI|nr:hypothetical protein C8A05DRAFT_44171 [Staphylotrichum longicolle]